MKKMDFEAKPFMTRAEVADRWGVSVRTLENWARRGYGPEYRRFGHRAMYKVADVIEHERTVWGDRSSKVSA